MKKWMCDSCGCKNNADETACFICGWKLGSAPFNPDAEDPPKPKVDPKRVALSAAFDAADRAASDAFDKCRRTEIWFEEFKAGWPPPAPEKVAEALEYLRSTAAASTAASKERSQALHACEAYGFWPVRGPII